MTDIEHLTAIVTEDLEQLTAYDDRHVGGEGNRAATAYFAERARALGLRVAVSEMPCFEWQPTGARLEASGERVELQVGPYSLPCDIVAPLVAVLSIDQLEREDVRGAIVLMHGDIARGQVMPRNFEFYNPQEHQRIYRALDTHEPAVVIAATGRDPYMVGSQYPFPLFEDGDLDVPNAFLTDTEGEELLRRAGQSVRVVIDSERVPSVAEHVVASLAGSGEGRLVISAHIDSRRGSPGALDNATGVATMLAVAELLRGRRFDKTVEFVPFNGEDDYANPGELRWIEENRARFDRIVAGINMDDSAQRGAPNQVSFYGCPPAMEAVVREVLADHPDLTEGPQWFQGDHAILGIYGVPAIAIASAEMLTFMERYAHTERDTLELADPELAARTALFVAQVVQELSARDWQRD